MKKQLKEELNLQMRIISTQAVMRSQAIADKLKLNSTDLETLEVLFREGKASAGTIAKHTGLTTGAVTGVIDRLARAGFVTREFDPDDRRKTLVTLNQKKVAKEVLPLYKSIADSVDKLLDTYPEKDLETISGFLKKTIDLSQEDLDRLNRE